MAGTTGRTRKSAESPRSVRIWAEAGVTLAVTQDPPQFIRFTFGHERIAPDDSEATIKRYEEMAYEYCEAVVEKRVKKLKRLIRRANDED